MKCTTLVRRRKLITRSGSDAAAGAWLWAHCALAPRRSTFKHAYRQNNSRRKINSRRKMAEANEARVSGVGRERDADRSVLASVRKLAEYPGFCSDSQKAHASRANGV